MFNSGMLIAAAPGSEIRAQWDHHVIIVTDYRLGLIRVAAAVPSKTAMFGLGISAGMEFLDYKNSISRELFELK